MARDGDRARARPTRRLAVRGSRKPWRARLLVAALGALWLDAHAARADDDHAPPTIAGAASCAVAACHGGANPDYGQYRTWLELDRHAQAFQTLLSDQSQQIVASLKQQPAHDNDLCLACHSTSVLGQAGPRFDRREGISCESCHGLAEKWLEPHKLTPWKEVTPDDKYGSLGMRETKNVVVRARLCVECHVGTAQHDVNHELLAAGHPPLVFELDLFTARMPPHWKGPSDKVTTFGAAAWSVGQAVAIKQLLAVLRGRLSRADWPEFAEFDCSACHHALEEPSWRQKRGYPGRGPGALAWSRPQWDVLRRLVPQTAEARRTDDAFASLARALNNPRSGAAELLSLTGKAEQAADAALDTIVQLKWTDAKLSRLLDELIAHADRANEPAGALHHTLAASALFEAIERATQPHESKQAADRAGRVRARFNDLLHQITGPAYSPTSFGDRLTDLRQALERNR